MLEKRLQEIEKIELSDKFDCDPIVDEVIVLKDMTEEFFVKNLLKINAIKESDKIEPENITLIPEHIIYPEI